MAKMRNLRSTPWASLSFRKVSENPNSIILIGLIDTTPKSTQLVERVETDHERFWMNIEGANSKDEKEFNSKAAKVKLPSGNEEDGPPPMPK